MNNRAHSVASDAEPLVTFKEAVRMLHSSHRRLKKAQALGHFHAVLIGKRWGIPRSEVLRLLAAQGEK
jgi:hypothetical protein